MGGGVIVTEADGDGEGAGEMAGVEDEDGVTSRTSGAAGISEAD